ncbi:MAG TPA: serine hydrolase [Blastocatellia bacterium]|nr:serine hydrolase [Blastocatellia bacterium]
MLPRSAATPCLLRVSRLIALILLLSNLAPGTIRARDNTNGELTAQIDRLVGEVYKDDQPGAAVIVVKNGETVYRKAFGMADLELGVKMAPDMVFRIGSITKQFTAVSILMLLEQGKLALTDELTKFFPDYPTHGRKITVENLLNHTSGIKSYTSLPEWLPLWRKDMSVNEIIALFKDKPMDFAPGEKWAYNNSGYILLGAIIEKVSGQSYEDFLQKNIFDVVGMKHSFYGSASRVIPRRIPGYGRGKSGLENAPYLSMTQPFAAGSLLSTVDDLAMWDAALQSGKLVKKETLMLAFTPSKLNNGVSTGYGFGWTIVNYDKSLMIEHGGGINGFTTYEIHVVPEKVFVAVLTNRSYLPSPDKVAFKIACLAMGKPYRDPVAITLPEKTMDGYVGVYEGDERTRRTITRDGNQLYTQSSGGVKAPIYPMSETEFYIKDSMERLTFSKQGTVQVVTVTDRYGPPEVSRKTSSAPQAARKEIKLDPDKLARYVGDYEIAPGSLVTVSKNGEKLTAQMVGQPALEIFAETDLKFFVKEIDAGIEFIADDAGRITGAVVVQGSQRLQCKKIK